MALLVCTKDLKDAKHTAALNNNSPYARMYRQNRGQILYVASVTTYNKNLGYVTEYRGAEGAPFEKLAYREKI